MRRLGRPTRVRLAADGLPASFASPSGWREVERIVDRWVEAGRWWDGESRKEFVRVEAGGMYDLSCDAQGQWMVELVWD